MCFWNSPSFIHRHKIKALVKPLQDKFKNFGCITITVLLKSGKFAYLSSSPKINFQHNYTGWERADSLLSYAFIKDKRTIFPEDLENDPIQSHIEKNYAKAGLHRGYIISKYCQDCCVLISYNTKEKENSQELYKRTAYDINEFSIAFINEMLPSFLKELPELKSTRFGLEKEFRNNALTANLNPTIKTQLNETEQSILYWSAQGKSAEETSIILGLKNNTINSYRKKILSKMNTTSITQAVYIASSQNLIA